MDRLSIRIVRSVTLAFLMLFGTASAQGQPEEEAPPATLAELESRISELLERTKTPGAGVVIVSADEVLWIAGLGKADLASGRDATPDTIFRIGSTSKGFVSLAVLKLAEEGRLSLDDTLASRAPEIEFENRWEETDPVRLVHLLEHTSGFDDIHLAEYASTDPKPLTLREGLDYHPDSRVSRWRPGTRFSYCNSGPAVAAYVVERVTGQPFEEYVQENFFDPLGMATASYLLTPAVERDGATLYGSDGVTPNPYWHIIMRPSGSINASARDLAGYIRFYLQRGSLDGLTLLSAASIERMERPMSSAGARAGLDSGYGLSNYTSAEKAFVFHGHNGGVNGGATEMAYLPEHGVGYAFMINAGNGEAFRGLSSLVRGYLLRGLAEPALPPAVAVPAEIASVYSGFYKPASPRAELQRVFDRIGGLVRLEVDGERLALVRVWGGEPTEYVAVTDRLSRRTERSVTSLALLEDRADGTYIEAEGQTYQRISALLVWGPIVLLVASVVIAASSVLFVLIWGPRRLFGGLKGAPHIGVRVWPLLSTLSLIAFLAVFMGGFTDGIGRLGLVTPYSVGQMLLSIVFALTAVWSLWVVTRARSAPIHRVAWWHSLLVAISCCSIALYLSYFGLIGLRSWSY